MLIYSLALAPCDPRKPKDGYSTDRLAFIGKYDAQSFTDARAELRLCRADVIEDVLLSLLNFVGRTYEMYSQGQT